MVFDGIDLERAITDRARAIDVDLASAAALALARHARAVLRENDALHLTTIVEPDAFLERHVGEALEGARLLDPDVSGTLIDLGSGNGYPALPLGAARPGLAIVLTESSARKSRFLEGVVAESPFPGARVLARRVDRPVDLEGAAPARVISARAVEGWSRILPRLAPCLDPRGSLLLWAGDDADRVRARETWRRFELVERRALPGRARSWVWHFRPAKR